MRYETVFNPFDDLHLYLKCHASTGIFKHFASKNQLSGLSVSGTLIENGLKAVPASLIQFC